MGSQPGRRPRGPHRSRLRNGGGNDPGRFRRVWRDIAAGGGSVWTTTFDRPLSRIDATTNRVLEQYVGGQGGDSVSYGFGSVWLTNLRTGTIWRIPY